MTGFEVAGVVLAVLPLVITALQNYNQGLKPLKDFFKYEDIMYGLIVSLGGQQAMLRVTLKNLLRGIVDSKTELDILLNNPCGPEWRSEKLAMALRLRLSDNHFVYMESVRYIAKLLEKLKKMMGLDSHGLPRWIDDRTHKKQWKKFRICLAEQDVEKLISKLNEMNRTLRALTDKKEDDPRTISRRRRRPEPFRRTRDHARSLHRALKHGWSCGCQIPHRANLQLETRNRSDTACFRIVFPPTPSSWSTWQVTNIRPVDESESPTGPGQYYNADTQTAVGLTSLKPTGAKMHLALVSSSFQLSAIGGPLSKEDSSHFPWNRKEGIRKKKVAWAPESTVREGSHDHSQSLPSITPRSIANSTSMSTPSADTDKKTIPNLCLALSQAQHNSYSDMCLGFLVDDSKRLGVYSMSQCSIPSTRSATLHSVLGGDHIGSNCTQGSSSISRGTGFASPMTKKFRIQLALTLACTTLQLQPTHWLDQKWVKTDIVFYDGLEELPYLAKVFHKSEELQEADATQSQPSWSRIRNRNIFNLGVLLLELLLGKSLHHFGTPDDPPENIEYFIAERILNDLPDEEPPAYVKAVRTCIFCDFGGGVDLSNIDSDEVRQAIYDDVVVPLEDEWEHWNLYGKIRGTQK